MAVTRTITRTDDVTGDQNDSVAPFTFSLPVRNEDGSYSTARHTLDASDETQARILADIATQYDRYVKSVAKALTYATEHTKVAMAKPANASTDAQDIRVWARENGFTVSERGRIPAAVSEAYAKSQNA